MPRPYWSGQVQISLVSFGVKLFVATESKSEIRFHQIDRRSGERVRHQKVLASALEASQAQGSDEEDAPEAAAPVQQREIVKGYEYSKGQYVTIEPEELAHLRVPSKHTMAVEQFVDESELAPEYFEKPYFVVPENEAQTEAFATVRQALLETRKVALTKIAFGGREHVVALAPAGKDENGGMMAFVMRYAAELRAPSEYFRDIKPVAVSEDSLSLAKELIKRKAAPFDPARFVDGYEIAVKELVDAKLKHLPVPQEEAAAPARGKVINLMDALRKSIGGGAEAAMGLPAGTSRNTAAGAYTSAGRDTARAPARSDKAGEKAVEKVAERGARSEKKPQAKVGISLVKSAEAAARKSEAKSSKPAAKRKSA